MHGLLSHRVWVESSIPSNINLISFSVPCINWIVVCCFAASSKKVTKFLYKDRSICWSPGPRPAKRDYGISTFKLGFFSILGFSVFDFCVSCIFFNFFFKLMVSSNHLGSTSPSSAFPISLWKSTTTFKTSSSSWFVKLLIWVILVRTWIIDLLSYSLHPFKTFIKSSQSLISLLIIINERHTDLHLSSIRFARDPHKEELHQKYSCV